MGGLLPFNDFLVFAKDVFRKPRDERPRQIQDGCHARFFDREIAKRPIGPLLAVQWRIGQPNVQNRVAAGHPDFKPLIRIVRADGHQVLRRTAAPFADGIQDRGFAHRRKSRCAPKRIIHFTPALPLPPRQTGFHA